jgi:hypothetical protein
MTLSIKDFKKVQNKNVPAICTYECKKGELEITISTFLGGEKWTANIRLRVLNGLDQQVSRLIDSANVSSLEEALQFINKTLIDIYEQLKIKGMVE